MKKTIILISIATIFITSCSLVENILPADPTQIPPTAMPTAVAEVLPPTLLPHEPAVPPAARLDRLGLVLWRVVEASLLSLVLVLAVATLVAKRRQNTG